MKTIDLSDLKVGDKAWSSRFGEVEITSFFDQHSSFPIEVLTQKGKFYSCSKNGFRGHFEDHPTTFHSEQEFREYWSMQAPESNQLTKREQFAMAAMQGLLAAMTDFDQYTEEEIADMAMQQADALLTKLNEKYNEIAQD